MKFIVQGKDWWGYKYDLKDGLSTIHAARRWAREYAAGAVAGVDNTVHNGKDALIIAAYETRSYDAEFVEFVEVANA